MASPCSTPSSARSLKNGALTVVIVGLYCWGCTLERRDLLDRTELAGQRFAYPSSEPVRG